MRIVLYERAKKESEKNYLKKIKPFNLTMLTVDTHFPNGYICDLCENKYDTLTGMQIPAQTVRFTTLCSG